MYTQHTHTQIDGITYQQFQQVVLRRGQTFYQIQKFHREERKKISYLRNRDIMHAVALRAFCYYQSPLYNNVPSSSATSTKTSSSTSTSTSSSTSTSTSTKTSTTHLLCVLFEKEEITVNVSYKPNECLC